MWYKAAQPKRIMYIMRGPSGTGLLKSNMYITRGVAEVGLYMNDYEEKYIQKFGANL